MLRWYKCIEVKGEYFDQINNYFSINFSINFFWHFHVEQPNNTFNQKEGHEKKLIVFDWGKNSY